MEWNDILVFIENVLNYQLFTVNETPITILSFIIFLLFLGLFLFAATFIRNLLNRRILKRFNVDPGISYTLSRVTQYVIVTVGVLISFQFIGINLSSLAVILGFLSVGIGFGLQNITSNFISGLIIMFERPISVGDRVMVNEVEGDVTEINIRATKIRTLNNVSIIVPNSEFVSQNVVNYSHGDPSYRLDVNVGVSYGSDLEVVLKSLNEVADTHEKVLKNPSPDVHLTAFGDSSWDMQLRVWIGDVKEYPRIRNELNQAIVRKFRENKVEIPFPQRDLHVRSSIPVPVSSRDQQS